MPADRLTLLSGETSEEILERRAESLSLEAAEEDTSDLVSMLLFRIGEERYAVLLADVREIFQEYAVTPIPCTPPYVLGVTNVRGEILSVTDAAQLMGIGKTVGPLGRRPPAIVVNREGVSTALVAEEIGDIVEVADAAIEPPVTIIDRTQATFIAGTVEVADTMVGLIDVARILEPIGSLDRH